MAARAVLRDVVRVLGKPYGFGDRLAKAIPDVLGISLKEAYKEKEFKELKRKGVEICLSPSKQKVYDGLRAEIKDPNGIAIELREWQNGDSIKNEAWRPRSKDVTLLAKSSPGETSTD